MQKLETKLEGVLMDSAKDYDFTFNAGNLCISIDDFSDGWLCKGDTNYLVSEYLVSEYLVSEYLVSEYLVSE